MSVQYVTTGRPHSHYCPCPSTCELVGNELKHFLPEVVGRGRCRESPGSVVFTPPPSLPGRLESILQYPPYQRNDHRPRRLGGWSRLKKVDAILLTKNAEPYQVSCRPLQCRQNPSVRHIDEAHAFEHQKLNTARRPGKFPSEDGPDGTGFTDKGETGHGWGTPAAQCRPNHPGFEGFPNFYAFRVVSVPKREKGTPSNSYPVFLKRQR
jgi:hypothetical protein